MADRARAASGGSAGCLLGLALCAVGVTLGLPSCKGAPHPSEELPAGAVPLGPPSGGQPPPVMTQDAPHGLNPASGEPSFPLPAGPVAPLSFAPIAKHADPSVVTITTFGQEVEPSPFFSGRVHRPRETKGLGTGFVVDKDGVVLTNNHVVEGADQIRVKLSNDREYPARIVGHDSRTDIAVVKIEERGLTPLALGDSDSLEVGDWVVAIGNPFGLSHTVSAGIVSAKGRSQDEVPLDPSGYYSFLQTDASINPGNSGGPLLNLKGDVVGINTAIRGGGAQGIGFAIPINMVKQLLPMLLRDGHVTRSALGVRVFDVHDLSPEDRSQLKLADDNGILIEAVEPGGAADHAGLAPGDVILLFDGKLMTRKSLLQWVASIAGVGKTVTLRISRDGKTFDIKATLGQLPDTLPRQRLPTPQDRLPGMPDPFGTEPFPTDHP
jgi:serine protease Do